MPASVTRVGHSARVQSLTDAGTTLAGSMSASQPGDPVSDFASACRRFISLCVEDQRPEVERLWSLRSTLGELVAGVDRLPVSWAPYDFRDHPTYEEVRGRVGPRYPSLGHYHDVLNPLDVNADPETAIGDVLDDLVDIYREISCGLELLADGGRQAAVGHWLNGFHAHWGDHALGAARAIHEQLQKCGWLPPERLQCRDSIARGDDQKER